MTTTTARNERSNRVSVFVTLLMSYLVVLLIPVIVFWGLYTQIERIMIENANNSNMALIEQAKQVVDSRLDEMHLISRNITSHPRLDALLKAGSLKPEPSITITTPSCRKCSGTGTAAVLSPILCIS